MRFKHSKAILNKRLTHLQVIVSDYCPVDEEILRPALPDHVKVKDEALVHDLDRPALLVHKVKGQHDLLVAWPGGLLVCHLIEAQAQGEVLQI